jgi:hypothetical protein
MSVQGNIVSSDNLVGWLVTQLVALGALLASLAGWIPYAIIAAIPTIYYLLMIWEMKTVQHALNNWRTKRIAKKYAKAQAKAKIALARLEAIDVLRNARHASRIANGQCESQVTASLSPGVRWHALSFAIAARPQFLPDVAHHPAVNNQTSILQAVRNVREGYALSVVVCACFLVRLRLEDAGFGFRVSITARHCAAQPWAACAIDK